MRENPRRPIATPTPRGVHDLALCTDEMKATIDFYVDVLGVPLVHAMKVPPGLGTGPGNRGIHPYERVRHYFFDMGNDSLLAFFEIPKGKEPAGNRNAIGAMQHCAFVVTAERFREVETRLKSHGIDYIGSIAQLPGLLGIYFYDPNGIRLEFACQPEDGEAPEVIPCVTQTKAEARDELATLPDVTPEWIEKPRLRRTGRGRPAGCLRWRHGGCNGRDRRAPPPARRRAAWRRQTSSSWTSSGSNRFAIDSPPEGDGFELPVPRSETTISASQRGNGRWRTQEASRAAAPTDPPLRLSRQPKSGAPPPESAAESRPFFTQRGAPGGWMRHRPAHLDAGLSTRRPSR